MLNLRDQAKVLSLIVISQHEEKNYHWNHHLKQLQYQEKYATKVLRYGKPICVGTLHAIGMGLACFLIYLGFGSESQTSLKGGEEYIITHPH